MTELQKITNRYNRMMRSLSLEYLQVNDEGEGTENWNLRDMVAECDYQLSTYYEGGHYNESLREYNYKEWRSEVMKLMRFINNYSLMAKDIIETERHSSKRFDNL